MAASLKVPARRWPAQPPCWHAAAFRRIRSSSRSASRATTAASRAIAAGATHVQGDFYVRPDVVDARKITGVKRSYVDVLREASAAEVDYERLAASIKRDVSLTYKLLRYVNSASIGVRGEMESVRSALVLLGGEAVLRWVCMATVSGLMSDKAEELAVVCATCAHFCEPLGPVVGLPGASQDLFATGMFSAIDALLDVPLEQALADLPLAADVRAAILGADNALGRSCGS